MPLFPLDYTERHIFKLQGIREHTRAYTQNPGLRPSFTLRAYVNIHEHTRKTRG